MGNRKFIPGLDLSRSFYQEIIEPVLQEEFPGLDCAVGLLGPGSEVLGFDDPMSTDHHWGPRGMIFLGEEDYQKINQKIRDIFSRTLPYTFRGYSTHFTQPNLEDNGTQLMEEISEGPINHRVEIFSLQGYCRDYLGLIPDQLLTPVIWLTVPSQKLRSFTDGEVFRDDSGALTALRKRLSYYPRDVWLYMLASGWARLGQEEHILSRTGFREDEIGSALIAARLVHDLMNICFLIEKTYPPYSKWFGSAFKELDCAETLLPIFQAVLNAENWKERELAIIPAYEDLVERFNKLGITKPVPSEVANFHDRPFKVIGADRLVSLIKDQIQDPEVKRIAEKTWIGAVEQFSTSTDFLSDVPLLTAVRDIY
jgi:hypothetical protein